jgi:hypothetical protein
MVVAEKVNDPEQKTAFDFGRPWRRTKSYVSGGVRDTTKHQDILVTQDCYRKNKNRRLAKATYCEQ